MEEPILNLGFCVLVESVMTCTSNWS